MSRPVTHALLRIPRPPPARSMATAAHPLPLCHKAFTLPDGRVMGVREVGAPDGAPLLFFPDIVQTRHAVDPLGRRAEKHNLRLIALERPGRGVSTPQPGCTLAGYPADVWRFVTARGLRRFGILATGYGSAHALACAYALPRGCVSAVGLLGGAAPWGLTAPHAATKVRFWRQVARWCPGVLTRIYRFQQTLTSIMDTMPPEIAEDVLPAVGARHAPPGASREEREKAARRFLDSRRANTDVDPAAMEDELRMVQERDWGFRLEDVDFGPVRAWHSRREVKAPLAAARDLVDCLPYATFSELERDRGKFPGTPYDRVFAEMGWLMGSEQYWPQTGVPPFLFQTTAPQSSAG